MNREELKEEMACLICGYEALRDVACSKQPVDRKGQPFCPDCKSALRKADKALCLFEQYCEENKIMQVVEGEIPYEVCEGCSCYAVRNGKKLFADRLSRAGYVKVEKVSLVDSTDCNEQIEHRYTGVLDFPRQGKF